MAFAAVPLAAALLAGFVWASLATGDVVGEESTTLVNNITHVWVWTFVLGGAAALVALYVRLHNVAGGLSTMPLVECLARSDYRGAADMARDLGMNDEPIAKTLNHLVDQGRELHVTLTQHRNTVTTMWPRSRRLMTA